MENVKKPKQSKPLSYFQLTLEVLRAANKLDAREQRNSARQQHCKASHLHIAVLAGSSTGLIPAGKRPAARRIVDVIEKAAFWHQQSVRLEWSFWSGTKSEMEEISFRVNGVLCKKRTSCISIALMKQKQYFFHQNQVIEIFSDYTMLFINVFVFVFALHIIATNSL